VGAFAGEGVSLFRIVAGMNGYQAVPLVSAAGLVVRLNDPSGAPGALQAAGPSDCSLFVAAQGRSRVVGHFDRNTFFNLNGAGTSLFQHDHVTLARDIFRFLAAEEAGLALLGGGCGVGSAPLLGAAVPPVVGTFFQVTVSGATANAPLVLFAVPGTPPPLPLPGCVVHVNGPGLLSVASGSTDAGGAWSMGLVVPEDHLLAGLDATLQALVVVPGGPLLGAGEASNGLHLTLGF
jgi:hypothetical protein